MRANCACGNESCHTYKWVMFCTCSRGVQPRVQPRGESAADQLQKCGHAWKRMCGNESCHPCEYGLLVDTWDMTPTHMLTWYDSSTYVDMTWLLPICWNVRHDSSTCVNTWDMTPPHMLTRDMTPPHMLTWHDSSMYVDTWDMSPPHMLTRETWREAWLLRIWVTPLLHIVISHVPKSTWAISHTRMYMNMCMNMYMNMYMNMHMNMYMNMYMSHITLKNESRPARAAEDLSAADQDIDMHANRASGNESCHTYKSVMSHTSSRGVISSRPRHGHAREPRLGNRHSPLHTGKIPQKVSWPLESLCSKTTEMSSQNFPFARWPCLENWLWRNFPRWLYSWLLKNV